MSEEIDYGMLFQPRKTVYVVKKDGSKEAFNVQKVIVAVGKSAYRALTKFTDAEKRQICQDVIDKVDEMGEEKIPIQVMHNIVESALEDVKPIVAKSYRDYRNYKQDFVRMMDDVYKKASPSCTSAIRKMQTRIRRLFPRREALFLTSLTRSFTRNSS